MSGRGVDLTCLLFSTLKELTSPPSSSSSCSSQLCCRWQMFSHQRDRSSLLFFLHNWHIEGLSKFPRLFFFPLRSVEMLLIHPVSCKVKQWGEKNRLTLLLLESGLFPEGTHSLSKSWLSQTLWRLSSRAAAANAKYNVALLWKDNEGPCIFSLGWSYMCSN